MYTWLTMILHWITDMKRPSVKANLTASLRVARVGHTRTYTPFMTVCMATSQLETPYMHRVCVCMYVCMYGVHQPFLMPARG